MTMNEASGAAASALANRLHLLLQLHVESSDAIQALLRSLKNQTVDQPADPAEASSPQTPPPKRRRQTLCEADDVSEPKFKQEADSDAKSPSFRSLPRSRPPSDRVSVHLTSLTSRFLGDIDRGLCPVEIICQQCYNTIAGQCHSTIAGPRKGQELQFVACRCWAPEVPEFGFDFNPDHDVFQCSWGKNKASSTWPAGGWFDFVWTYEPGSCVQDPLGR